jgi:site-specific recombinase XerD
VTDTYTFVNTWDTLLNRSTRLTVRTRQIYADAVRDFLCAINFDPERLTAKQLAAWRDQMIRDGLTAKTVNLKLTAVKRVVGIWARYKHDPRLDFAAGVPPLPAQAPSLPEALTEAEVQKLLVTTEPPRPRPIDYRDRALIQLILGTGIRATEIARLKLKPLRAGRVTLRHVGDVELPTTAHAAALAWSEWLLLQRPRPSTLAGPAFRVLGKTQIDGTVRVGEGMDATAIYHAIRDRANAIGLVAHPAALRQTYLAAWRLKAK